MCHTQSHTRPSNSSPICRQVNSIMSGPPSSRIRTAMPITGSGNLRHALGVCSALHNPSSLLLYTIQTSLLFVLLPNTRSARRLASLVSILSTLLSFRHLHRRWAPHSNCFQLRWGGAEAKPLLSIASVEQSGASGRSHNASLSRFRRSSHSNDRAQPLFPPLWVACEINLRSEASSGTRMIQWRSVWACTWTTAR